MLKNKRTAVNFPLDAAKRCLCPRAVVKPVTVLDRIHRLRSWEGDPDLKRLVFTKFLSSWEEVL